jgi:predicted GNAT family N-acyltransferase
MTRIEEVSWQTMSAHIRPIREAVFIDEQAVPVELEWDGLDEHCTQLLAFNGDDPIGTARMTNAGKIGRMAVLQAWRRQGVGSQLLATMLKVARQARLPQVELDAQIYAMQFYQNFGFETASRPFMDAGIRHQKMTLQLGWTSA